MLFAVDIWYTCAVVLALYYLLPRRPLGVKARKDLKGPPGLPL